MALADTNRERLEGAREYLGGGIALHEDLHGLLGRKDVDAVVVTTPDYLHEEHCVAAFDAGKHVLVDKPLAITGAGCLRVIEAARRADKLLYMGFNMRHHVVVRTLKRMIDEGRFGDVFMVHAIEYYDGGRTYMSRWNRLKKYSGGLWIHKGSHDFDVINWLVGAPRPVRVSCSADVAVLKPEGLPFTPREGVEPGPNCRACAYRTECPDVQPRTPYAKTMPAEWVRSRDRMFGRDAADVDGYHNDQCMYLSDKDTHDHGIAIVEYDNGATAMHSECFVGSYTNRLYFVDGTRAHAEGDVDGDRIVRRPRWRHDVETYELDPGPGGHGGADPKMCAEFVECLLHERRPSASGIDGAWSVAIGEAAELARTERRVVEISEVLDVASPLLVKSSE